MMTAILTQVAESAWYVENFWPLVIALMAPLKAVMNLVPTDSKAPDVFGVLDKIVSALIPDRLKK